MMMMMMMKMTILCNVPSVIIKLLMIAMIAITRGR